MGKSPADAQDLAQEFLSAQVLRDWDRADTLVHRARRESGHRFRGFLGTALANFHIDWQRAAMAIKRGGGKVFSFDELLDSGAQIVGKALDWIHLESADATVFRPVFAAEKYADFVAGGTMLISRGDLMSVGGWRPVPKSVDRALLDRVLAEGGLVYRAHGLGYVYARHSAGHTATVSDEHFLTRIEGRFPGLIAHEAFGTAVPS